jgi:hypothetical protein
VVEPGQFYEYQPGGTGDPIILRIERVKGDIADTTMRIGSRPNTKYGYTKSGVHLQRLGRQITEQEAIELGWDHE